MFYSMLSCRERAAHHAACIMHIVYAKTHVHQCRFVVSVRIMPNAALRSVIFHYIPHIART